MSAATTRGDARRRLAAGMLAVLGLASGAVPARAYFEAVETSSRALAFGNAWVALATDPSAVAWNPGGLGALRGLEVQSTLSRPFVIPDLTAGAFLVARPLGAGGVGFGWHRIGNAFIAENVWMFSYGRWVYRDDSGELHLGGTLKIGHVGVDPAPDQPEYGGITVVTGDVGALWVSRFGWNVGATVRNLGEPEIEFVGGGGASRWDGEVEVGAAYRWRAESTVGIGWTTAGAQRDALRAGGEIWFYDVFAVRLGVVGTEFSGGIGLRTARWRIDSSFLTHQQLGLSGRVTLSLPFGEARR